ncbi:hypothetical protein ACN469_26750 [Corallococcus terminator]
MKTLLLRGVSLLVLSPWFMACGGIDGDVAAHEEVVQEATQSQGLVTDLPACESMNGQTCTQNLAECLWQSDGSVGVCVCRRTPVFKWQCYPN